MNGSFLHLFSVVEDPRLDTEIYMIKNILKANPTTRNFDNRLPLHSKVDRPTWPPYVLITVVSMADGTTGIHVTNQSHLDFGNSMDVSRG
jgi:hypothetical protein